MLKIIKKNTEIRETEDLKQEDMCIILFFRSVSLRLLQNDR